MSQTKTFSPVVKLGDHNSIGRTKAASVYNSLPNNSGNALLIILWTGAKQFNRQNEFFVRYLLANARILESSNYVRGGFVQQEILTQESLPIDF